MEYKHLARLTSFVSELGRKPASTTSDGIMWWGRVMMQRFLLNSCSLAWVSYISLMYSRFTSTDALTVLGSLVSGYT